MWISNTATTAMMLPIVDAIAEVMNEQNDEEGEARDARSKRTFFVPNFYPNWFACSEHGFLNKSIRAQSFCNGPF
jgi:di/tricarboxylate transporter